MSIDIDKLLIIGTIIVSFGCSIVSSIIINT